MTSGAVPEPDHLKCGMGAQSYFSGLSQPRAKNKEQDPGEECQNPSKPFWRGLGSEPQGD